MISKYMNEIILSSHHFAWIVWNQVDNFDVDKY